MTSEGAGQDAHQEQKIGTMTCEECGIEWHLYPSTDRQVFESELDRHTEMHHSENR